MTVDIQVPPQPESKFSILFDRLSSVMTAKKEEIITAKKSPVVDNELLIAVSAFFLAKIIFLTLFVYYGIVTDWVSHLLSWVIPAVLFPILLVFTNWGLLVIESHFQSEKYAFPQPSRGAVSEMGDLSEETPEPIMLLHVARLFGYILITYWAIQLVIYVIYLAIYFQFELLSLPILLIFNTYILKIGFRNKELLTCFINAIFAICVPFFGFMVIFGNYFLLNGQTVL